MQVGKPVRVEIPGLHKSLEATITRTSQKVSTATRTMDAEVDIANDDLSLIPGMYASVRVDVDTRTNALLVPIEALSRSRNPTVYAISADGLIEERKVKLGIEAPDQVEALEGVRDGDLVMIGNRSQVRPGQKVTAKLLVPETTSNTH
jgi:membrane fusion protein (multidrug efflux system)